MKKYIELIIFTTMVMIASMPADADVIRCAGVLGNSGEQGSSLVRFEGGVASGIGVVCDRYGSLWDRGGTVLNRYAVDGRLMASYKLPQVSPNRNTDGIVIAGDTLFLRFGKGLYTLSVDAPSCSEIKSMNIEAENMSFSSRDGWVTASKGTEVFLVNAVGEKKPVAILRKNVEGLDFGPDGGICVIIDRKLYSVKPESPDGVVLIGSLPGERTMCLNGYWYGSAWHSTLRRCDKDLNPSPGVVLGGNSGAFIGHVAEQSEIVNARGLALVRPDLFAISGFSGVMHLLEWKGADRRFEPIRRIGALQSCGAIGLDGEGRSWCVSGNWDWSDGPATPQHWGVPISEKVFGIVLQESDSLCGYGMMWGKPMILYGKMDKEIIQRRIESQTIMPKEAVDVTLSEMNGKRVLMVLESSGKVIAANINHDGSYNSDAGLVQLNTLTPVKEWTSLESSGKDSLIGAGDGFVIEFGRDGGNWKEKRRWNSCGGDNGQKFGPVINLAVDSGRLWISDKMRHSVACFDLSSGKELGRFGKFDASGTGLSELNIPTIIAARGKRAVVFDSGNQRVMKLELIEASE